MHCFPHGFRLLNLTIFLVLTGNLITWIDKVYDREDSKNLFAIFTGAFCESSESNDGDGSGIGDDDNDYNSGDGVLNFSPSLLGLKDSLEYEVRNDDSPEAGVKLKSRARTFQTPHPHVPGPVQAKRIKLTSRSSPVGPTKILLPKPTAESKFPDLKVTLRIFLKRG